MNKKLIVIIIILSSCATPKKCCSQDFKKYFKFATFYAAANGGNSISDIDVFSVTNGLETVTVETPYDYNLALVYVRLQGLVMKTERKHFMMVQKSHGQMGLM